MTDLREALAATLYEQKRAEAPGAYLPWADELCIREPFYDQADAVLALLSDRGIDCLARPLWSHIHLLASEDDRHRIAACGAKEHTHGDHRLNFTIDPAYIEGCAGCFTAAALEARAALHSLLEGLEVVGWRASITGTLLYGVHQPHHIPDAEPVYRASAEAVAVLNAWKP